MEAIRLKSAALGEYRQQRLFPKDQLSDYAITSPEAASAPRAWPQLKAAQDNRIPALQNLWVRNACVGHVTVYATAPMPARAGAGTTSHCLIVAHTGIAQGHIIHAALGGCAGPKSPQNDIYYSLRCEYVASDHCCLWGWIQYGAFGNYDMHRSQATLVKWDVTAH